MNKRYSFLLFIVFAYSVYASTDISEEKGEYVEEKEDTKAVNKESSKELESSSFKKDIFRWRGPSSKGKIKKTKIRRDQRFKIPKFKVPLKKRKRISLRDIQPPASTRFYYQSGTDEAELEEVINEEINQLFKLLKRNRSADLTLRLGSLYVEKARHISFKIQADYEKKKQGFRGGKRKTKPYLNLKPARVYNRKSLKLFKDFKESYPKHKRMDEILFFLGFNFYQLENEAEGIKYFSDLESRFPKSPYLYEARFQLGEHYFQLGKWKSSFKYYDKISRNKRGKFYFFALYKMAWSAYKMGRASQGLALLERIIREGRKFEVVSDRNQVFTFNNEAIQDLVLFYTYSRKTAAQAKSFFLNLLDDKQAWRLLRDLAYAYRDTGQTKGIFVLFEDLIEHNPVGEEAFEYKYQIVETMYNFGNTFDIIKNLNEWVRGYGPDSAWVQANRGNQALIKKSFTLQEVTIRNYALKNHETFKRTKRSKAKNIALSCYKIYFNYFAGSEFSDQMQFFYGELLFDSKKYISAVKSYEDVIVRFPNSKYTKAAFVNQILALEKALPAEQEIQKLTGKGEEPVELTNSVKSFMKVAERYIKKFPNEKNTPSILYRKAALYYKFNQFSMAARYFKKLSDEYPTSKLVGSVGGILLDIYNKNKDYKSLEELALQLSKNKAVDKNLLREVRSVLEQISFKKAQDLALKKQYKESALLYEKFARANPNSTLAPTSFYNAGLNFEKNRDSLSALSMYSAVLTYKGGQHKKIRKNSQEFLAILYEKLGFYRKAANAYVSFAKSYPSDAKTSDFWYNAGVIFDALNDRASAVYSYQQHFARSKKSERHEVFFLIGLMYEKNRRWQKAVEYYDQYLKSPTSNKLRVVKASFAVANIYEKRLRNLAEAKSWHQKTLSLYKRLKVGVSYGARSHFYITQDTYKQFSQVRIPLNTKKQEAAIAKKIKLLKNLERALKPIIRYNDGEQIVSSLTLIAQANKDMARAIYQAPIPKGLNKKGVAQYKEGIKKLIQPYIKEAVNSYQLALKKSEELKIYTERAKKAYEGLASIELKEGKFQRFLLVPIAQKVLPLQLIDNKGTVTDNFFQTVTDSLKYGVSKSDFENLSRAMATRKEVNVLKATSVILNKDSKNVLAINSLALFYLKNNKQSLGTLVLNRISSKNDNDPVIMNNLAIVSLKYGDPREAVTYLKKALSADSSYSIARVNLATIFLQQHNYEAAYAYYKNSYNSLLRKWAKNDQKALALLNNYGVALTLVKKWKTGSLVFKKLSRLPSPQSELLLNYAIFLAEKSKEEKKEKAMVSLSSAKGLVDELTLYKSSAFVKRKVRLLSRQIDARIKELKAASLNRKKS